MAGKKARLRRVARALLAEACNGNVAAAAMIADRLDGKVPQPTGGSDELGPQRLHISWGHAPQPERMLAAQAAPQIADAKIGMTSAVERLFGLRGQTLC